MPDLKELFDDAVAYAPAETHSAADIVRAARRDHTRRTTVVVAGLAAAVVAIVGVGIGLSRQVSTAPPPPGPAYQPPAGALALADAIPAEPRVDYFDGRMVTSDGGTERRFTSQTNSGGVVLMEATGGVYSYSVVGTESADTELTPPPGRTASADLMPLAVDDQWEVWGDRSTSDPRLSVRDVASGEWFDVAGSLDDDLPSGAAIDDVYLVRDKLYVVASAPEPRRAMQYVAPMRPGSSLEPDLPEAAIAVGAGSGMVAWVPVARPDVVEVVARDFDEEMTLPLDLGPGCELAPRSPLATNSFQTAVWVQCDGGRVSEVRTFYLHTDKRWPTVVGESVAGIGMVEGALVINGRDGIYLLVLSDQNEARLVRRVGRTATDGIRAYNGGFIWNEAPDGSGPSRVVQLP